MGTVSPLPSSVESCCELAKGLPQGAATGAEDMLIMTAAYADLARHDGWFFKGPRGSIDSAAISSPIARPCQGSAAPCGSTERPAHSGERVLVPSSQFSRVRTLVRKYCAKSAREIFMRSRRADSSLADIVGAALLLTA